MPASTPFLSAVAVFVSFFFLFLNQVFTPSSLLVAQVKDGEDNSFPLLSSFSIYHASYYSFKDGRYSGFNGVAANNAFASNGVMIPAPIASGIPLIAATPAKVLNKRAESTP